MRPPCRRRSLAPAGAIACALAMFAAGCLVIPVNRPTAGSRQNVGEEAAAKFENGVTTMQDVVLALGEPDLSGDDGTRLGYRWSRVRWIWVIAAGGPYSGGVAGGEISRESYLEFVFDRDGLLLDSKIAKTWSDTQSPAPGNGAVPRETFGPVYAIDLQPRAHPASAAAIESPRSSIDVKEVVDLRDDPALLGEFTSLGVKVGDIECSTGVAAFLKRELAAEIVAAGHEFAVENADITIEPSLTRFHVWTKSTLFYFDVISEVECDLVVTRAGSSAGSETRHYSGRNVERTYLIPGSAFFSRVAGASIDDLLAKIRADPPWNEAIAVASSRD